MVAEDAGCAIAPLAPAAHIGNLTTLGLAVTTGAVGDHNCIAPSTQSVLVVGDGNFSFARAFMRKNASQIQCGALQVVATSLDTHEELLELYPKAVGILNELQHGGVTVIHDINATKLEGYPAMEGRAFDRIVFNFPHFAEGGSRRNKIHRHRQLLREFFASAIHVLKHDGQIWVALCAGQGGTALDTIQRSWGDTWQVVQCAASAGLLLESVHACPVEELSALGYYSVGYQLREQPFWTVNSLSHVFCRDDIGRRAQLPIEWDRDMSFWITDAFTEEKLLAILDACFPQNKMSFTVRKLDDYRCPKTDRLAVTYRLHIRSSIVALSKEDVNDRATCALTAIEATDFASSRAT